MMMVFLESYQTCVNFLRIHVTAIWKDWCIGELKQVRRIGFFVENYNWYIYTYIWLRFMANVGKHTSPMDGMGYRILMLAINLLLHP